jgi:phage FluMu gp28-like protein
VFTPAERLAYCDAFVKYNNKPIELDRWQELYIQDASPFSIILKGRRVGFSFAAALKGLVKANDFDRTDYTRQYVSYNMEDAVEKIRAAKMLYESIPVRHKKRLIIDNRTSLEFLDINKKTTSRLISIPCRPPRGRGGDIVLDEFAIYMKNASRAIYTAALPVISRGGAMEIGSTPLGLLGMFAEIWHDRKNFSKFTQFNVPWWQSQALCINVEEARKADVKEMDTQTRVTQFGKESLHNAFDNMFLEDFQQEYECTFIDGSQSYIPLDLIYANTPGRNEESWEHMGEIVTESGNEEKDVEVHVFKEADSLRSGYNPKEHGRLFIGYDVARRRDAAVIFVIGEMPDGKKKSIAEIVMINKDFEYQRDQFRKIMSIGAVVRACIDQTQIGEMIVEWLQKEYGAVRIEGVMFNIQSKEELAMGVKMGLENREFLLQNDRRFHAQIHSIKRIATSGGAFRYDSERDESGHADSFWAWALANHAVIGAVDARPNFYKRWREKREHEQKCEKETAAAADISAKPVRGKSRDRVLKELLKGAK